MFIIAKGKGKGDIRLVREDMDFKMFRIEFLIRQISDIRSWDAPNPSLILFLDSIIGEEKIIKNCKQEQLLY